jgi:hypothetical protein
MFDNSLEQAIAVLNNTQLEDQKRELAIQVLAEHRDPATIKALVNALQFKEFSLRWTASTTLAQFGAPGLVEVLRALLNPELNTAPLREGIIHILHYGSNLADEPVYKHNQIDPQFVLKPGVTVSVNELLKALKGPAADINSMIAASQLLQELEQLKVID